MERYFDPEIMDWVYLEYDDCEYIHDPDFWTPIEDMVGGWDHVR